MAGSLLSKPGSFESLCETPAEFLKSDVAALNLICATGLPGAESIDIGHCLETIDRWADYARRFTDSGYSQFISNPSEFENSQGYFCVLALVTALQRDLGVRYNPAKILDPTFQDPNCFHADFSDSRDAFIHGIIDGPGGTCATMPVVCVAVGRRLGYPLKLVESPGHLFARWDDPDGKFNGIPERFNIECTGQGLSCYPDDRYTRWPREWTQSEIDAGCYLNSHTPNEELAHWLANRGCCLEDNGRVDEALQAYHAALALAPYDGRYRWAIMNVHQKQRQLLQHLAEVEAMVEESQRRKEKLHGPQLYNHGPSCQCAHCRPAAPNAVTFGHPPSYLCSQCRGMQSRPGHLTPRTTYQSFPDHRRILSVLPGSTE